MKKVASLVGWLLLGAVAAHAQTSPKVASDLSTKSLAPPGLEVSPSPQRMEEIPGFRRASAWERFQARVSPGQPLYALFDEDGQRPAIVELSVPWIPGSANGLRPEEVAGFGKEPVLAVLERLGREFVREHEDLLGVSEADLVLDEAASQGTRPGAHQLWHLVFDWAPHGTRVQGARIVFRVSRGNLIQVSTRNLGDREAVPRVQGGIAGIGGIGEKQARESLGRHVGGFLPDDTFVKAELRILSFVQATNAVRNAATTGRHRVYRAAWVIAFRRGQDEDTWEGAVDAKTGEVLSFGSTALHGYAFGKIRPNGNPAGEVQVPFPYVDYRPASTPQVPPTYSGFDGFLYNVEPVISNLQGRTAKVNDGCGAVELTGNNLDFGGASPPGSTDCNSQSGGDGNTAAARTAYYWVTWGKEWARSYLPGLSWLFPSTAGAATTIQTNAPGSPCVAFYDFGTQNNPRDTLVFRRSGDLQSGVWKCRNSGELVSHIFHEFGHGLDHNDGIPIGDVDRSSTEAYGDIIAALVTRDSCIGRGFDRGSNQSWCGYHATQRSYNCTSCDGFRDVDWRKHTELEPHTPATNLTQCENESFGVPVGPCGKQRHCETSPVTEAMWDLVPELEARGYSENDAWEKATDLFLSSRPGGDDMFTCANANGSREGGTPGGSLYHTLRAADDDCDGNPNDGTANAAAIYAALARHDIAVGSASDPRNQNDPCDLEPVADFTFTCTGRSCSFDGSSSKDDFGIVSWAWSFGDATSPVTEGDPLTSHTYASSNQFQVTLTVTDTIGQTGSTTRPVLANLPPVATFSFNCTGLSCSFDASGSTDDNPIAYYLWSWGDGTPNTGYAATANHAFAAAGSYTVSVTVADSLGGQSTSSRLVTVTAEAAPNPIRYFALPPCRLLDTRGGTILTSGTARVIQVTGACGIPASARSVSLNATVVSPTGSGRLSFYPGDQAASSATTAIDFTPATSPRANNSMPRLGANGTLGVLPSVSASPGQVHLVLDVQGYFSEDAAPAAGAQGPLGYQNVTPCRVADTRPSSPLTAGSTRTFTVQGVCGIPAATPAVNLNLTATQASAGGFMTLFASNTAAPPVSSLNFNAGTALANGARTNLAPATPDLALLFASGAGATAHAIVDAHGYFRAGAPLSYRPIAPCRAVDTRVSSQGAPAIATGTTRSFQIRGNCGVPSRARAVFLNVIAVAPTAGGHLSAFPSGTALPAVPNLNFDANEPALGNGMIVPLSTAASDLSINVFAPPAGSTHVVVDVFGWFDDPPPTACFTYSCNLRTCTFDSSCSSDNQSISTRTWNFGDGTPAATGLAVTHVYAAGGPKQVTLTVADNIGQTDDEVKTVPVNRPPSAAADFLNTPPGVPSDLNVLANDTDLDGDPISVSSWSSPSVQGGTVIKNLNGTLRYSPPAGYQGPDSFTYRISDGKEESSPATVTVSVNNPPDARDDGWSTYSGGQTNIPYTHLLGNDYDRDGDPLTVTGINTAGLIGSLDCSFGTYCRYTSPPTYQGTTSFTYSASDGKGGTDPATVRIKVGIANADPVPQDDLFETVRNTPVTFQRAAVLLNDSDPNGDVLSVPMVYRDPITSFGTVSCSAANYVCTYTPSPGFTGVDFLWYQSHDGVGVANARIRILVRPPSPPVLDAREDQMFFTTTGAWLSYAWMTSNDHDPEGGALTVVSVDITGLVGTLDCTTYPTGCEYTRGTSNPTRFRYTVRDPQGNLDTTTVTLKPGNWSFNQTPVIVNDQLSTRTNTPLAFSIFDVLRNDYDPDNDQLDAMFSFGSAHGQVSCTTPAYFCTYTPNAGFTGTDTLTYWANDRNNSVQGSVTMTVQPVLAKDAQILSQSVPASMFARQSYPVSMRLKNVGTQAWSLVGPQCNAFRLGAVNPYDNTTWGSSRAELPATVPPGGEVTLSFTITAPSTPGTYNFQRRMVHECVEWFGDLSPNAVVTVSP